ncbi:MAG: methyl-accepting chemotaxis protein [Puniceicoccaceae bacterium 5H]|nr:MAG: methyl-accepting chemotaxis protein [Puniceicoccaceae bacterium 5H]
MSWKNLSLGQRIIALCVLVVVLVCGIAASSYVGVVQLNKSFHAAIASTEEINNVNHLEAKIQQLRASTNEYLATNAEENLTEALNQHEELHQRLADLQKSSTSNQEALAQLDGTLQQHAEVFNQIAETNQKIATLRDDQIGPQVDYLQKEIASYLADARSAGNVGAALSSATSLGELYSVESSLKEFLRTGDPSIIEGVDKQLEKLGEDIGELKAQLEELRELDETLFDAEAYARLESWQTQLVGLSAGIADLNQSVVLNNDLIANTLRPLKGSFAEGIAALQESVNREQSQLNEEVEETTASGKVLVTAVSIAGVIAIFILSFFIVRSTTKRIQIVANHIFRSASETRDASGQISRSSEVLADGASRQAASLEETSASLEEMAGMTRSNAGNAEEASRLATEARSAAEVGSRDMEEMTGAMNAIQSSSDNISKIIRTIDEIAFQTNLLALNAAVEAARAGEAGAGFAVVADEVRSLAHRSAEAARETSAKIEDSLQKSANGVRICNKVGESLRQIVDRSRDVDQLVGQISASSKEQSSGITQIERAVSDIDKLTQENAGLAEETSSASQMLMDQSRSLDNAVRDLFHVIGLSQDEQMKSSAARQHPEEASYGRHQNVEWEEHDSDNDDEDDEEGDRHESSFFGAKSSEVSHKRNGNGHHEHDLNVSDAEKPKKVETQRRQKVEHKPETPSFFRLNGQDD